MAIIKGEIDSLTKFKNKLAKHGIYKFETLDDIKHFEKNYESKILEVVTKTEEEVHNELQNLKQKRDDLQLQYHNTKSATANKIQSKINNIRYNYESLTLKKSAQIESIFDFYKLCFLLFSKTQLEIHLQRIIKIRTYIINRKLNQCIQQFTETTANREALVNKRSAPKLKMLARTKQLVDIEYNLLAGAVGEHKVVSELKKLPDDYILYNDYALEFNRPIFNRKEEDRNFSVQIDHLLVSKAGIFIIETKNWSKETIANAWLRSPIEQIERTNYAMFVLLNSSSRNSRVMPYIHHWGNKKYL